MKLVLNGVNGGYLRNIVEQAQTEINLGRNITERVDAAVAYATEDELLFNWCWDQKIPLRFWGRFDDGVPVSIQILEKFLKRRSPNYSCRLVRHFHPKVIWFRGFGAYIGSANLSQSAWWKNFEAGVFLTEEELVAGHHDLELEQLFSEIDKRASPLSDELFELIRHRARYMSDLQAKDKSESRSFLATDFVRPWDGLSHVSQKKANETQREAFLAEWNGTLQILRDLATKISLPKNRPGWVYDDAPSGAQADQFLHGHYYQRTFDGRRADYESFYQRARLNPEAAVDDAIDWWRSLPSAPNYEDRMLNEWAPFLREMLAQDRILKISESEFVDVLSRIHAARDYARRVSNKTVGLRGDRPYTISEKVDALAKHIYRKRDAGPSVLETWHFVLYDGSLQDLPSRMWLALSEPSLRIDDFGISAFGELIGWALPDIFPPRNGRTSKALRSLGYDVTVHV